jgi:hypothetical protein
LIINIKFDGQLALKTVNGARSAFASFIFQRSFFHSYRAVRRVPGRDLEGDDGNEEEPLKCKISIKVYLYAGFMF